MSDGKGADDKHDPGVRLTSTITGHTKGSQPLLIVFATGGVLLVLTGIVVAAFAPVGYVGITVGVVLLVGVGLMWNKSQPDVDRGAGDALPAEIEVSANLVRVTGKGALVHTPETWKAIAKVVSRFAHQAPLPPAAGLVDPQDPNKVAQRFTPDEAQVDAQTIRDRVARDQQQLLEIVRGSEVRSVSFPQAGAPALPHAADASDVRGLAAERNKLASDSKDAKKG
jgi:hypothetical protein